MALIQISFIDQTGAPLPAGLVASITSVGGGSFVGPLVTGGTLNANLSATIPTIYTVTFSGINAPTQSASFTLYGQYLEDELGNALQTESGQTLYAEASYPLAITVLIPYSAYPVAALPPVANRPASGAVELDLAAGLGYGGDLALTPTGDLLKVIDVSGNPAATTQRLARIILTNPLLLDAYGNPLARPDDLFNPTFGSGARSLIGEPLTPTVVASLRNRIIQAMLQDPGIATSPAPTVTVYQDGTGDGQIYVAIVCYTVTGEIITLPSLSLQIYTS